METFYFWELLRLPGSGNSPNHLTPSPSGEGVRLIKKKIETQG